MKSFAEMQDLAIARKGQEFLAANMPEPPAVALCDQPDDRLLAAFAQGVFQAGFSWKVIAAKWPGFEAAFHGFNIGRNAFMSDEDLDAHLRNTDIVRHAGKILSVRDNAVFLSELARDHGSAAAHLGNWPREDTVGLFALLKKHGARLGGGA